jgi:flagellar hook-associated protein 2
MSESQIKMWEDKAKLGILQNDQEINRVATNLQNILTSTVSNKFGLFTMGITTAGYQDRGKLIINEDTLRTALEQSPDQVEALFSTASTGIADKLQKAVDDAVRTSGGKGNRGTLVELAGYKSTLSDTENNISTQINNYLKRIDNFKSQLQSEESRLWSKFSSMETALAKINDQNSMLQQYLGTGASQ